MMKTKKNIFIGVIAVIAAILGLDTLTGKAATKVLSRLWNAGSRWLRWGIGIVAAWPILMVFAALTANTAIKAIIALIPLIGITIIFLRIFDPMIIAAIGEIGAGRKLISRLMGIVGFELIAGIYFAVFPLSNDRALVPLTLLLLLSIPFILFGMAGKARRWLLTLVVITLIGIAVVVSLGGREEAKKRFSHPSSVVQHQTAELPSIVCHSFPKGVNEIIIPLGPTRWEGVMLPDDAIAYTIRPTQWDQIKSWQGGLSPIDTPSQKTTKGLYIPIPKPPKKGHITQATFWIRGEGEARVLIERE